VDIYLTVGQVMQTEGFRDCKLLAGSSGLGRQVTKITVAELPDTLSWMQGGELVCSTACYLKDNPEAQEEWIIGMAERNVAALAIKTQRFLGRVPDKMIYLAEKHEFPLIELPYTMTWPVVIGGMMSVMLDIQTQRITQSIKIHEKLTELVLTSQGLNVIIQSIADLVANPVMLTDHALNLLAKADSAGLNRSSFLDVDFVERLIAVLKNRQYILNHKPNVEKSIFSETIDTHLGPLDLLILPVSAGDAFFGWLTTILVNQTEETLGRITMEYGSTILALELLKEKASLEALARAKTDFLRGLLEDDSLSGYDIQRRAGILGINLALPTIVMIVHLTSELTRRSHFAVEQLVKSKDSSSAVISGTQDIIVFFHPKSPAPQDMKDAAQVASAISAMLEKEGTKGIIGIGRCYQGIREVKKSYAEAKRSVLMAVKYNRSILSFVELGFERILSAVSDRSELTHFCQDVLGKLLTNDSKQKSALFETLKCYLKTGCNQTESARILHLHINSMAYRIKQIEEILAVDLSDPDTRLTLYLAIKIIEESGKSNNSIFYS
jgi:purine catabolism regulator